jgi:hypothetical protein
MHVALSVPERGVVWCRVLKRNQSEVVKEERNEDEEEHEKNRRIRE